MLISGVANASASPRKRSFVGMIQELVERGFMQKWIRDYKGYVSLQRYHCNATTHSNKGYLDFHRAQGAFWILAGGVLCGAAVLFLESTVKRLKGRPVSGDGSVAQRGWRLLFFRSSENL
ncbi:unnamed protein product [Heligmosomoides polygyrus]|uniref:PBPe domain-containing protein n=1 Tax=Heligmosomoides polygyrus TaxID=6339 RepID=A0A183FL69_HELPZ|nr:unnamed protein product [Heligmosomoides polygyrus]